MGLYDTYYDNVSDTSVQIKIGNDGESLPTLHVGSASSLMDGVYVGYGGAVTIRNGTVVAVSPDIFDKWGNRIEYKLLTDTNNPVYSAIKALKEGRLEDLELKELEFSELDIENYPDEDYMKGSEDFEFDK